MRVHIKRATSAPELDQLFRVRHEVFCREQRYMPEQPDGRLADRFDAFPDTQNFVALVDGAVVGGVRIFDVGAPGFPAQEYFDFTGHVPEGARLGSGGMLVVSPFFRHGHLPMALAGMAHYWCESKGLTHLAIIASPLSEKGFLAAGYRAVAPRFQHAGSGLIITPMVLALPELTPRFASFVEHQKSEYSFDPYERLLLSPGDTLISAGERPDAMYVVREGSVGLVRHGHVCAELGPGAVLGDAAIWLGQPVSHGAVALSDVTLMIIPRNTLLARMRAGGEAALHDLGQLFRQTEGWQSCAVCLRKGPAQAAPAGHAKAHEPLPVRYSHGDGS